MAINKIKNHFLRMVMYARNYLPNPNRWICLQGCKGRSRLHEEGGMGGKHGK